MKLFLANLISFLPWIILFIAGMCSLSTSALMQYMALGCIALTWLLYAPCQWFAAVLWGRS